LVGLDGDSGNALSVRRDGNQFPTVALCGLFSHVMARQEMVNRNRVLLTGAIVIAAVLVGMTVPTFVPAIAASNSQSVLLTVNSNGGTYLIQANGGYCTIQFTPGQVNNSTATNPQQPSISHTNATGTQSSITTQQLPNNSSVHYNLPYTSVGIGPCPPASSFGK